MTEPVSDRYCARKFSAAAFYPARENADTDFAFAACAPFRIPLRLATGIRYFSSISLTAMPGVSSLREQGVDLPDGGLFFADYEVSVPAPVTAGKGSVRLHPGNAHTDGIYAGDCITRGVAFMTLSQSAQTSF